MGNINESQIGLARAGITGLKEQLGRIREEGISIEDEVVMKKQGLLGYMALETYLDLNVGEGVGSIWEEEVVLRVVEDLKDYGYGEVNNIDLLESMALVMPNSAAKTAMIDKALIIGNDRGAEVIALFDPELEEVEKVIKIADESWRCREWEKRDTRRKVVAIATKLILAKDSVLSLEEKMAFLDRTTALLGKVVKEEDLTSESYHQFLRVLIRATEVNRMMRNESYPWGMIDFLAGRNGETKKLLSEFKVKYKVE